MCTCKYVCIVRGCNRENDRFNYSVGRDEVELRGRNYPRVYVCVCVPLLCLYSTSLTISYLLPCIFFSFLLFCFATPFA